MVSELEWPEKAMLLKASDRLIKDSKSLNALGPRFYGQEATDYERVADFLKYLAGRMK
jgi:hypothetical protein